MIASGVRKYIPLVALLMVFGFFSLSAQEIRINEVVSSNSQFLDEDGDTPDWFELHNYGSVPVNLMGWTITDDVLNPTKWTFPEVTIEPGEYFIVWASGKDRLSSGFTRTLVNIGDDFKYLVPNQEVDPAWIAPGFDDSNWNTGPSGFGYGDGDDNTVIPQGTPSVLARRTFTVSDKTSIQELILDIDYDDSFVAYINGVEVARFNVYGNPPAFNTLANSGREASLYSSGNIDRYIISTVQQVLMNGENTLAVRAHNVSNGSSDMSLIPFLSIVSSTPTTDGIEPPSLLQLSNRYLHSNFKFSSSGEEIYLMDNTGTLVDNVLLPALPPDISFGSNGQEGEYLLYESPTPGAVNSGTSFIAKVESEVLFSDQGGSTSISSLSLTGAITPELIRYTLDGTEPTESSTEYTGPIEINGNTIVRAAIYRSGYYPSEIYSRTYIKGNSHQLPIVSLVTDPANLFDPVDGIYVLGEGYTGDFPYFGSNIWEDWERPVHVSLYEKDGSLGTEFNAGFKIFGGWSRAQAQKSFSFFARGQYGLSEINYPIFPDNVYTNYQGFTLRNSGNDFLNSNMRDGTLTSLMRSADLEIQAYRPAVTYINGAYWGIYGIREKVNEHYLASRGNVSPNDIDLLETNGNIIHGSNQDYFELIQYISTNSLSVEDNYNYVASKVDIENYITYQLAQIYFDNTDWPGNNIKFWKAGNGKWRWILYDTDFGFGTWNRENYLNNTLAFALEANGPGWPNPPWSTFLFRNLMNNQTFKKKFINYFADNMNTRFVADNVVAHIDSIAQLIEPEINSHYTSWGSNYQNWANSVFNMKYFAQNRPAAMKNHIKGYFNLPAIRTIYLHNDTKDYGYIKLNSIGVRETDWQGDYFQDVPIQLTAIPDPGYTFTHWSGSINSTEPNIEINLTGNITVQAHFVAGDVEGLPLVINEINYNSSLDRDSEDWVELYNPNTNFMDIGGWELRDNDNTHSYLFPAGTIIEGRGYIVIARSLADFEFQYPSTENVIGSFDFGLSSTGDAVRIFNNLGEQEDAVYYQPSNPWPAAANGGGYTLELLNPFSDNQDPANWSTLNLNGSPGRANSVISSVEDEIENFTIHAYPNPTRNDIVIELETLNTTNASMALYDFQGKRVMDVFEGLLTPGLHHLEISMALIERGLYLLRYSDAQGVNKTVKILKY